MEIGNFFEPAGGGTIGAGSGTGSGTAISSDFETFIRMLTVQMRNQDPLNPVESSDFAVQLATFSAVEQQVLTNDLLRDLGNQITAMSIAQLSGWIGLDARAQMPVVFNGSPVTLTTKPDVLADAVQLVVFNGQGAEIQRLDISSASEEFAWAGTDGFGNHLPNGTYFMVTESFSQGALLGTQPVEVHGRIVEARNDNGQPVLVMAGGQAVSAADIIGLSMSHSHAQ